MAINFSKATAKDLDDIKANANFPPGTFFDSCTPYQYVKLNNPPPNPMFFYSPYLMRQLFENDIRKEREKGDINIQIYHSNGIEMSDDEEINGYKLYNADKKENPMTFEVFEKIRDLWGKKNKTTKYKKDICDQLKPYTNLDIAKMITEYTDNDISDEEFMEWIEAECCSDWAKQDQHGECYGGYWEYPEGSYEKEHAWELSKKKNFECLCDLPYPREAIKYTIELGCENRQESVRYSNFLCEWTKRKMEYMKTYKIKLPPIKLKFDV